MNTQTTVIESSDGTRVATEITGSGPPFVVVAAALSDRSAARRLASQLADTFTVYTYDRRGRGDTELLGRWSLEGEVDDIAALVRHAGGSALLFGSSSGAALALRAAAKLGPCVRQLILFEPPFIVDASRPPLGPEFEEAIAQLLERRDHPGAVRTFLRGLGMPPALVAVMRFLPGWRQMVAMAPTISHDLSVLSGTQLGRPLPPGLAEGVSSPTVIVTGGKSDAFFASAAEAVAAAIPGARHDVVPGLNHAAVEAAPMKLGKAIRGLLVDAS
jgi:pimeloyl-ACP methyl ester carboxylesterase